MTPVARPKPFIACCEKCLPAGDMVAAAAQATTINPANAPPPGGTTVPQLIAVMTTKYWGAAGKKFGVRFLDSPTQACKSKILAHMNAWNAKCNVSFAESAQGEIRISRGNSGYWSYLGTDILSIPSGQPTMNLQGFTENTSDAEYRRVVRHETGHTLGCPHEHMRRAIIDLLDVNKTINYFRQTHGWSQTTTIQQVLTPVEESALLGSPSVDQDSIMCYQLPGACTKTGKPVAGGADITANDFAWMATLYPKPDTPVPPPGSETVSLSVAVSTAIRALTDMGYKVTK